MRGKVKVTTDDEWIKTVPLDEALLILIREHFKETLRENPNDICVLLWS